MTQPSEHPTPGPLPARAVDDDPYDVDVDFEAGRRGRSSAVMEAVSPAALPEAEPQADGVPDHDVVMWAVVFAGGIGSRFWPLSTPERPKPLLSLLGDRPLIANTVDRLTPLIPPERVLVLTSRDIADAVHRAIPDVPESNVLVEPRPLGTAAALAWGAHEVARRAGGRAVCCAIHADLAVAFPEAYRAVLLDAGLAAEKHRRIVTVGVRPTRPETAFGYIRPGAPLDQDEGERRSGAPLKCEGFIEKPAEFLAQELIETGALWHSGIVAAQAGVLIDAIREHVRELAPGLGALASGDVARFGGMIQSVSIERGLLERSDQVAVVPGEFGWDDVGTWACLRRARDLDDYGNGVIGPAHFADATGNVVHSENGTVVLYGVSQMLVVSLRGITLVTTLDRARDLKPLLDTLPGSMRLRPAQTST